MKKLNAETRFWNKVIKTEGCWNWIGCKIGKMGYGQFRFVKNGKIQNRAHRVSWIIHNGEIPDGLLVLHKCDNPLCVRPDHLFLGTDLDNATDRMKKGRFTPPIGERNGRAKLNQSDVLEIRRLYYGGMYQSMIAERFGVSQCIVSNILTGKSWKHIK